LVVAFSLCFPSFTFAQIQNGMKLEDALSKDFTVEDFIDKSIDPREQIYEPSEYVTQELNTTNIYSIQNPVHAESFKPLSELSADNEVSFGAFVQEAEEKRSELLAKQQTPIQTPSLSLEQPASPLEVLLGNNTKIANPQDPTTQKVREGVNITISKDSMLANIKEIRISVGEKLPINIQQNIKAEPSFFLRNQGVVSWNAKEKTLYAEKEGSTELYVTTGDKMAILSVHVGNVQAPLQLPSEMLVLNNLEQARNLHADLESFDKEYKPRKFSSKGQRKREVIQHPSVAQTDSYTFALDSIPFETEHVQFRILDEQSGASKIIPIPEVELHIVGSELTQKTDVLGMIAGLDVPRNSSFLVSIKDPLHRYHDSVVEISASQIRSGEPISIRLMDLKKYSSFLQISSSESRKEAGSLCATVQTLEGKPFAGLALSLNLKQKPQYFNHYGYLDPLATETSDNGRFCVFDMDAGPLALTFRQNGKLLDANYPLTIFAGSHLENTITVGEQAEIKTVLAATPTAFELLGGGQIVENEYRAIDRASLISFGVNPDWDYDPDTSSMHSELSVHEGRSYYLANSSEFETTLYRVDTQDEQENIEPVTPLFPFGFLKAISGAREIDIIPNTGTVYVDHGSFEGQSELSKTVEVTLLNHNSEKVGDKVSLTTISGSSTVFYNLEPGTYSVIVKSENGEGLAYDTVLVYSHSLSYKHTGSPRYRVQSDGSFPKLSSN